MSKLNETQTSEAPTRDNNVYTKGGRTIAENTGVKPVDTMVNILNDIDNHEGKYVSDLAKEIQNKYTHKELTVVLLKVLEMYRTGVPFSLLAGALYSKEGIGK